MSVEVCEKCGAELRIGDWPWCPHGRVLPAKGYEPHFDIGLGQYVTGWGDVRKAMRENRLDFRDHPSPGQLSARRDRIEQQKREAQRGERAAMHDGIIDPPATVTVHGVATVLYDHRERPMRRRIGFK